MAHHAVGRVTTLFADQENVLIALDYEGDHPLDNYFQLKRSHANFNAVYSLLLAAAANRWPVHLRTDGEIEAASYGAVRWASVSWVT